MSRFSLAVYCGSRSGNAPAFLEAAIAVGHWIGQNGGELVYGGGKNGLMGAVADAALEAGAKVYGVIPRALHSREHVNFDCTELHMVDTMPERKEMMAARATSFLALAGGIGTFEEIVEMWVQRQLGFHNKRLGFLNTCGYYKTFFKFVEEAKSCGFMSLEQEGLLVVDDRWEPLLPKLCL